MLTIGEAARLLGTTPRTLRFYHQRGLVPEPERDELGHRRYGIATVHALKQLLDLRGLGLPLARCAELLDGDGGDVEEGLLAWEEEIARRQQELEEQRLMVVRLRESRSRARASAEGQGWAEWAGTLTDRGVPSDLVSRERAAAQLLSIVGDGEPLATPVLEGLDQGAAADAVSRLAELSPADEDSPETAELVEDLAGMIGPFVRSLVDAPPAPVSADGLASGLLASFPPAQRRVMRRVMARVGEETPPPAK
ncbi:MerR family transcriptional regulator [Nocardiopsis sp. HNM0947]|uniref:MerR family transcriptional regulator n=1 Tax=Nocardiopsis coralli TaxID=2772213 RepID=A0ABR9PAD6_9ACTN|nr:MerR family transcriptional regulator [Nocardiopsis coralli]MBE3000804.1 MerR family transcriptional regulator [Nocardiopsis coralli]